MLAFVFCVFVIKSWWIRSLCVKDVMSMKMKFLVGFRVFTLSLILTTCRVKLFLCSTFFPHFSCTHLLHWMSLNYLHYCIGFYSTGWHRNTATSACLSWAWRCLHSLIIYVLCCHSCPNTSLTLNICNTIFSPFSFSLHSFNTSALTGEWFTFTWSTKSPFGYILIPCITHTHTRTLFIYMKIPYWWW